MTEIAEDRPKVVALSNGMIVGSPGQADPEVVDCLERLLEEAKSGVLSGFVMGCVYSDKSTGGGWAGNVNSASLIGAIELEKLRVLKVVD